MIWLLLAVTLVYLCAIITGLFAGWKSSWAWVLILGGAMIESLCILVIPADRVGLRTIAAFICTDAIFKTIDYARRKRSGRARISIWDYCFFLVPFPVLLVVYPQKQRRVPAGTPRGPDVLRALVTGVGAALMVYAVFMLADAPMLQQSFLLDHIVKISMFIITVEFLSRCVCSLERLAGFDTVPIIENFYLARTVAEFWRRYNKRVHAWLYHHVFRLAGARRHPVRTVCLTFFVSGLLHELMFGLATSRFDGYQLAFFSLQAPGALASNWMETLARRHGLAGKTLAHTMTVFWMAATSMLFFHGVDRIIPFVYASDPWLP